ncbi:MAG: beta-ketoacyl synthase N-terminal-like domain-containing protein [Chthoniobacteraceae bacterium]
MDDYPVRSSADGSVGGVVCHAVPLLTEGFEGEARLLRLVQGGLEDLARQCPDAPWKRGRTSFYLSMPDVNRLTSGAELLFDEEARKEIQATESTQDPDADPERARQVLKAGAQLAGWHSKPDLKSSTTTGNSGVAEALDRARQDLSRGECEIAIVGGVDSLLDEDTLSWLEATGRLKTPDMASGLQPGEACGFVVLETQDGAAKRNARTLGRLDAVSFGEQTRPIFLGEQPSRAPVVDLLVRASQTTPWGGQSPNWLIHDLSGETYGATEWGNTLFGLATHSVTLADPKVWFSTPSFGYTGAATGAIQLCVAVQAFARSYSPAKSVALISSSDARMRGCVVLSQT